MRKTFKQYQRWFVQVTSEMKAVVLALLISSISAYSVAFNFSVDSAGELVKVTGDVAFDKVIPGQDYEKTLTAEMVMPKEALNGIIAEKVVVRVVAESSSNESWVYFRENNQSFKSLAFDLTCVVEDNKCGNASIASRKIVARLHAPLKGSYPHTDKVVVTGEVNGVKESVPISSFEEFTSAVKQIEEKIKDASNSTATTEVRKILSLAQEKAEKGDYSNAFQVVQTAKKKVEESQKPVFVTLTEGVSSFTAFITSKNLESFGVVFIISIIGYFAFTRMKKNKHRAG